MQRWPRSAAETICPPCRGLPPRGRQQLSAAGGSALEHRPHPQRSRPAVQYRKHFAMGGDEHEPEPAFPDRMPWYFRHTSRFATLAHARSLMQVRCCSTPLGPPVGGPTPGLPRGAGGSNAARQLLTLRVEGPPWPASLQRHLR
jgi:hypothetical protein